MAEELLRFKGKVRCVAAAPPLALTLCGTPSNETGEVALAFSARAPGDFPESLEDAVVERVSPGNYRITSGARAWLLEARAVHVHREVAAQFYRAIPPRPVPFVKRLLWSLVLRLGASRLGIRLLRVSRG
ncbi:MAG TPA: hypothetical protein VEH54_02150 [Steroidobacteraceae bacterium]|nr:hypothetical protein [Steroidobacteraceae bacterium]